MTARISTILFLLISLAACDPYGYYEPPERRVSSIAALQPAELDARIAEALATPAGLPSPPLLLAVAGTEWSGQQLAPTDAESGDGDWFAPLREAGLVGATYEITPNYNDGPEEILAKAAAGPAEALLLVHERIDSQDESTPLAMFYPTIVGMAIMPGSYRQRTVVLDATLWNTRTRRPYFSITANGSDWSLGSLFWVERYDITDAARQAARKQLVGKLKDRLGGTGH